MTDADRRAIHELYPSLFIKFIPPLTVDEIENCVFNSKYSLNVILPTLEHLVELFLWCVISRKNRSRRFAFLLHQVPQARWFCHPKWMLTKRRNVLSIQYKVRVQARTQVRTQYL